MIGQHQWQVPNQAENQALGLPESDWRDPQYDMLYLPITQSIHYHYDFNGNRTTTVLPDGRQLNHLYYGSGHLHQINLDGETISDIERDKLHREIERTQGKLTSRYELDPLGRLKKQIAQLAALSEAKGKTKVAAGQSAVKRSYGYDRTGNLTHSSDQRSGTTHFDYDKLGRITKAGDERFAFDPAHNILSDRHLTGEGKTPAVIPDNRLKEYNGISYYHDELGNLIHRELPSGEVQNYFYDLHDQLVKAEIFKKDGTKETWLYRYDALGRRIAKAQTAVSDRHAEDYACLKDNRTEFLWDGSHLLQENGSDGLYTYIYTDLDSYEPLAQIHNWTNAEGESQQQTNYFHCDQIGIPREMTDSDGNLLWFGDYHGWGKLKSETNITNAHQSFRLQNQYCDVETGLHYNFFRYYEPDAGRFISLDPIRLSGGSHLYQLSPNVQIWFDPLGLFGAIGSLPGAGSFGAGAGAITGQQAAAANSAAAAVIVSSGSRAKVAGRCEKQDYDPCRGQKKIRMRHFTNSKGIQGIQASNMILASDQNKVFAVPAKGKPMGQADFERNFGLKRGRAAHYVDFDTCPGEFTPRPNSRNSKAIEFVHDGPLGLLGRNPTYHRNR